jgi:hypothetical protein
VPFNAHPRELTDTAAPKSGHWHRPGYEDGSESLQRIVCMDIETEDGCF